MGRASAGDERADNLAALIHGVGGSQPWQHDESAVL